MHNSVIYLNLMLILVSVFRNYRKFSCLKHRVLMLLPACLMPIESDIF